MWIYNIDDLLFEFFMQCICMGRMDTDRNQLENRLPLDLLIVGIGVIVHNVLSYAVFIERRKIENQEQNILYVNGM